MSLEQRQIDDLVLVARSMCKRIQAASAIIDTSTDILAIADFSSLPPNANTTAKIAVLVNRYFREGRFEQVSQSNRSGDIAET